MSNAIVYIVPSTASPMRLSAVNDGGNVYRKELIYVGAFAKKEDDLTFAVDEPLIDHWVDTFALMYANGVKVPLPIKHTTDVEANRGETLAMFKATNQFGLPALYADIKFRDADAEKLALTANCSIYVPPESTDGKGNTYIRPVAHIALTDYPVIPKLDKFTVIAASLTTIKPPIEELKMSLARDLINALSIEGVADDADDLTMKTAILSHIEAVKKPAPVKDPEPEPEPKPIAAAFITLARDNREGKLDALVPTNITRATANEFKKQYCSDESLALCLSEDGTTNDGFDALILTLSKNVPTGTVGGSTTGVQADALKLSKDDLTSEKNPLMANAMARAKAAAG